MIALDCKQDAGHAAATLREANDADVRLTDVPKH